MFVNKWNNNNYICNCQKGILKQKMNNIVANESINNEMKLNGKEEVYKGLLLKLKKEYFSYRQMNI